jgi:tetratricopeptide (TPR) repeat protein
MEQAVSIRQPLTVSGSLRRIDLRAVSAWLVPAVLAAYLGIQGGGFDSVINSQVGIVAWWALLLIAAFRLAALRLRPAGRLALGLLVAFAAWTTISLAWTQSSERTMGDVSLELVYVALALLVFIAQGRAGARHALNGLAFGIAVVAGVAVLSRLHFAWFSPSGTAQALPNSTRKLSYPLNYWNALADLIAIGIPVTLRAACGARTIRWRALAGATLPLLGLCAWLTVSRGGAAAIAIGVAVFALLVADRIAAVAVIAVGAAGAALLIGAIDQRTAVRDGLRTVAAAHQGNEMIAIAAAVAIAVGLLVAAIGLVERHAVRPRLLSVSRRSATAAGLVTLLVAVLAFTAAGGFGFASREWTQFKTPTGPPSLAAGNALQRLQDVTGNGRYQYWQAAVREANTNPLTGTGAGTFKFWWAQHGSVSGGYVQDAHSLYVQALGELGYPGLILIAGFVALVLGTGVARSMRTRDPEQRLALAAATAGATAFAFAAAFEWIWLIPVLPLAFFVLAGVVATPSAALDGLIRDVAVPATEEPRPRRHRPPLWRRLPAVAACLGAAFVIALPMAATEAVRDSQALARSGNPAASLDRARDAVALQPYAASPWLQEALVLEVLGRIPQAVSAARHATRVGPTDYDNWLVLSRLQARDGHAPAALADYVRARSLSPNSRLFQGA